MIKKRRYSNELPVNDLGVTGDYSDVASHQEYNADGTPKQSSASGLFDWGNFASGVVNAASSVLTSIYGRNNQWQAQAYNTMYEQEKRTNTVLWVVIGLVVALGVFLIIRKTK